MIKRQIVSRLMASRALIPVSASKRSVHQGSRDEAPNAAPPKTQLSTMAQPDTKEASLPKSKIDMKTESPGPLSQELRSNILKMQQMGTVTFVSDMKNSQGNYIKDVDGNTYLDCFMQIASMPLGYNHPRLIEAMQRPENLHLLVNRPTYGWFPNEEWVNKLERVFMSVAPKNLEQIYPMMCGTCSNENAIKLVFQRYMHKRRGGRVDFTQEELETTMQNKPPGSPKLSMLSFRGGFHGRTIGLLSCSNSRPIHGVDIPTLPWPKAEFPRYQYPLEQFVQENRAEDDRCLASVEDRIDQQEKLGIPVAGIIVEPFQAEGGDNHASPYFFQELDKIRKKHDLSLVIDEVQTGGGSSGKMWAHEWFNMPYGPDIVTFSKKMVSGGIYHNLEHRPPHPARILNTWLGDPHKVIILEEVLNVIREENLLGLQRDAGQVMLDGLKSLEEKYPHILSKARGLGTLCSVDCPDVETKDKLVYKMRQMGVIIGGCGESSIRLRPALIFGPEEANLMIQKFEDVLKML